MSRFSERRLDEDQYLDEVWGDDPEELIPDYTDDWKGEARFIIGAFLLILFIAVCCTLGLVLTGG